MVLIVILLIIIFDEIFNDKYYKIINNSKCIIIIINDGKCSKKLIMINTLKTINNNINLKILILKDNLKFQLKPHDDKNLSKIIILI